MKHDVVVIGSGPAGACAALPMIEAGLSVLMLEKGPDRSDSQLRTDTVFGPAFSSAGRGDELKYVVEDYLMPTYEREARDLSYTSPGDAPSPLKPTHSGWMSQLVGGGSVHYGGASFRQWREDFKMKSLFGPAVEQHDTSLDPEHRADLNDWPFELDDLAHWYAKAEREIGIAAAPAGGLPPLRFNKAADTLQAGLAASGSKVKLLPTPMGINSAKHQGRTTCQHSGLCQDYACRFRAKSDMRVTLLERMLATGRLTIRPNTIATCFRKTHGKVSGVDVLTNDPDGITRSECLPTAIAVVACETLESSRLLLNSQIGNPEVLGRYLMFHVTGGARSLAKTPTTTWDTAPHTTFIDHYYMDQSGGQHPFVKTGILLISSAGGPLGSTRGRYWGTDLRRFIEEVYPYKMDLSYIGESLPTKHNRVELSTRKDALGIPGTAIRYQPHPMDLNAGRHVSAQAKALLKTAARLTLDDVPADDAFLKRALSKGVSASRLFHATGGCRMGEDPRASVTTPNGRVHGIENLYVADGSLFPTGSGVNPTLTIQANAMRIGHHIATS